MFWTIVGALLFVFFVLPVCWVCLGAIYQELTQLPGEITAGARWVGRAIQGLGPARRRRGMGAARRTGRLA